MTQMTHKTLKNGTIVKVTTHLVTYTTVFDGFVRTIRVALGTAKPPRIVAFGTFLDGHEVPALLGLDEIEDFIRDAQARTGE